MSLLVDERTLITDGALLLHEGLLPVRCRITIEWLRGIAEPTWYGYFVPLTGDLRILPGCYRLRLPSGQVEVLVRRMTQSSELPCYPFWGMRQPPEVTDDPPAPSLRPAV